MLRKLILQLGAVAAFAPFAAAALAAEIRAEGTIDSSFTYVSTPTTMLSADGNEATSYDVTLVLTGKRRGEPP